ncbi:family 43 glycosylhydrolase [Spirillospora sp. NPDC029432]|uniref:family 43 glycosylhydrolase n=1 Tax=Spirillospora sp. NPDC029432 TaxID=3154599 RepID=UPI003455DF8A
MRHQPLVAVASGALVSTLVAGVSALVAAGGGGSATPERSAAASPPAQRPMGAARPEPKPVIGSNFPDPEVLKVGSAYYGYATNDNGRNVPVATAPSPTGPWTRTGGDALPGLPAWAEPGRTWAPDVSVRADGAYLLYFTAGRKGTAEQCVGAAVARTPAGPFTPEPAPLACRDGKDTIDPAAFTDTDGARYVLYKQEGDGRKAPGGIFLQRTTPDGLRPQGARTRILEKGADEPDLVEAPALVKRDGRYVLFYAAGVFWEDRYQTRYATAASITGPYGRAARPLLSTEGYGEKIIGPGGADVVHDGTDTYLAFHGITRFMGGRTVLRSMYVARLGWAGTAPVVRGSPVRHEAEDGRVYGGRVLRDVKAASGGAVVGYLDNAQALVDIDVYAPAAGAYLLKVRHNNRTDGGGSPAEHVLTVNGAGRTAVRYPPGASGEWRDATVEVGLRAGWNVLRLAHGGGFAELDYIEVS